MQHSAAGRDKGQVPAEKLQGVLAPFSGMRERMVKGSCHADCWALKHPWVRANHQEGSGWPGAGGHT